MATKFYTMDNIRQFNESYELDEEPSLPGWWNHFMVAEISQVLSWALIARDGIVGALFELVNRSHLSPEDNTQTKPFPQSLERVIWRPYTPDVHPCEVVLNITRSTSVSNRNVPVYPTPSQTTETSPTNRIEIAGGLRFDDTIRQQYIEWLPTSLQAHIIRQTPYILEFTTLK